MTDTPGDAGLLPCPFCGGAIDSHEDWCPLYGAQFACSTENWNRRTRHTPEGGGRCACGESGKPLMYTCEKCDETWFLPGGMDIFNGQLRTLLAQAAPQSGAPDAPRVHCPACSGWLPWDIKTKRHDPCPGVQAAPPALSAVERHALSQAVSMMVITDSERATIRALLARTAEKP